MVARGEGREELEVTANGFKVFFWGDDNVPELDSGDGCITFQKYQKNH